MARAPSSSEPMISPVRRDNFSGGIVASVVFHVLVIGAFWVSLPYLKKDPPIVPPLIVDLVPIDEITAAPPKPAPKVEEQPEPPKPDPKPTPPPEQAKPTPPPEPEPPKPEPPPPPPPKPEPVEAPPPPKVPPPPPKPQPPKPKKDDMADLEKLLKDMQKKQPPKQQAPSAPAVASDAKTPNVQTPNVSDRATMTEQDAIRRHIEGCWRIDPGMEGIENLSAELVVLVTPDGNVQRADIVDTVRYFADAKFRTFANSVRIAVLSCKGIPISPQHYNELKDLRLNFSPQGRLN